jgi:hypothetical protein
MKHLCGRADIINYDACLGSGTHGVVYESLLNPTIAVKVFKENECEDVKNKEYVVQEVLYNSLQKYLHVFDKDLQEIIMVPNIYGFMYLPDTINKQCCMYYMDKLEPIKGHLIQLSFNYSRDYDQILSSGRYVGIDSLKTLGIDISLVNRAMASMMALCHFKLNMDAFDVEFVLCKHNVNYFTTNYPFVLKRKLTEQDVDIITIKNDCDLARVIALTIHYCPHIAYEEYQEWKDTYLHMANKFGQLCLAQQVIKQFECYF